MLSGLLWLVGCGPVQTGPDDPECAAERPEAGHVRAKQVVCSGEIPAGGEARIGDWLLENSRVRLIVRNQPNRLTQLTGGGGTIIDAEVSGEGDDIIELVPRVAGEWPEQVEVQAQSNQVVVTAADGSDRTWVYSLQPDSGAVLLTGASGFTVVPSAGSEMIGDWLHGTSGLVIAGTETPIDRGGWVDWNEDTLWLGTSRSVTIDRFASTSLGVFETAASHVEFRLNDAIITRQPTTDGVLTHEYPDGAEVRGVEKGHHPSAWTNADQQSPEPLAEGGVLVLSPIAPDGDPIPFMVTWNDEQHPIGSRGGTAYVGPGPGSGQITAGPGYLPYDLPFDDLTGQTELEASLVRVARPASWVAFGVPASPGPAERRTASDLLLHLGARGFNYAVLTAVDEVARGTSDDASIPHHSGSKAGSPEGSVYAWPWTADSKEAAHGAAPWSELSPAELLSWMSKAGRRYTAVDTDWMQAVGSIDTLQIMPDLLLVRGLEDLPQVASLYDGWNALGLIGTTSWVDTETPYRDDILRAILEGRAAPGTGPQLILTVNGAAPGDSATDWPETLPTERIAEVDLNLPGDIETVRIVGPGAETIHTWSIDDLPTTIELPDLPWVMAVAEGTHDWSMTGAIWLQRP